MFFFFIGVSVVAGAAADILVVSVVFVGDVFFFLLPFTRVHPSSLSGWTPVSVLVFFLAAVVVVVVVVFVVVFVVSLAVVVVLFVAMVAF